MKNYISILLFVKLLFLSGCASAISPAREAYIQAKPHGWIELNVRDSSVPLLPIDSNNVKNEIRAPRCNIIMNINNENYLSEHVVAVGENAPFTIDTGFRVTVPEGSSNVKINYIGCKLVDDKITNHVSELVIIVKKGFVVPLTFDGVVLSAGEQIENHVVTLDSINTRLKNIESNIGN